MVYWLFGVLALSYVLPRVSSHYGPDYEEALPVEGASFSSYHNEWIFLSVLVGLIMVVTLVTLVTGTVIGKAIIMWYKNRNKLQEELKIKKYKEGVSRAREKMQREQDRRAREKVQREQDRRAREKMQREQDRRSREKMQREQDRRAREKMQREQDRRAREKMQREQDRRAREKMQREQDRRAREKMQREQDRRAREKMQREQDGKAMLAEKEKMQKEQNRKAMSRAREKMQRERDRKAIEHQTAVESKAKKIVGRTIKQFKKAFTKSKSSSQPKPRDNPRRNNPPSQRPARRAWRCGPGLSALILFISKMISAQNEMRTELYLTFSSISLRSFGELDLNLSGTTPAADITLYDLNGNSSTFYDKAGYLQYAEHDLNSTLIISSPSDEADFNSSEAVSDVDPLVIYARFIDNNYVRQGFSRCLLSVDNDIPRINDEMTDSEPHHHLLSNAAAEPNTITPRQDGQTSYSTGPLDSQQTTQATGFLSISDLCVVVEAVWAARSRWYYIGLKLGTSSDTLDAIKASAKENVDDCFRAMIKDWLNNGNPRPTWAALAKALKSPMVGYGHLARQLPL